MPTKDDIKEINDIRRRAGLEELNEDAMDQLSGFNDPDSEMWKEEPEPREGQAHTDTTSDYDRDPNIETSDTIQGVKSDIYSTIGNYNKALNSLIKSIKYKRNLTFGGRKIAVNNLKKQTINTLLQHVKALSLVIEQSNFHEQEWIDIQQWLTKVLAPGDEDSPISYMVYTNAIEILLNTRNVNF